MGIAYIFEDVTFYFDLIYMSILSYISIINIIEKFKEFTEDGKKDKTGVTTLKDGSEILNISTFYEIKRYLEALLCITIWAKMVHFFQLIDKLAPLIEIVKKIFTEILWFGIIFLVVCFAFAWAFFMVGQNQDIGILNECKKGNLDESLKVKVDCASLSPEYTTLKGAMFHVYLLSLGEFGLDAY
jgi:hypothetical protein